MTRLGKVPKLNFHPSRSRPWLSGGGVSMQASHPAWRAFVQHRDWVHPPALGLAEEADLSWRGQVSRPYPASSPRQAEAQDIVRLQAFHLHRRESVVWDH